MRRGATAGELSWNGIVERDLAGFGRVLAARQGWRGDESIDWLAYGAAARLALARGQGMPLLATFLEQGPPPVAPALSADASARDRGRRRMLSVDWTGRVVYGFLWRVTLVFVVSALATRGFVPTPLQYVLGLAVLALPGAWRPWRRVWRWLAVAIVLAEVVSATDWYTLALGLAIAAALPAAILAARRWRIEPRPLWWHGLLGAAPRWHRA